LSAANSGSRLGNAEPRSGAAVAALTRIWSLLLSGLLLAVCLSTAAGHAYGADSLLDKQAPEFVRTDLNGARIDLAGLRGKVVLLNFWATWCAPCQVEMPAFVAMQRQYGPQGLQIIGISMDDDPMLARNLYVKLKLNYPVAMGDEKLGLLYGGVLGLPLTYLIDRRGKVRARFQGETSLKTIELQVKHLIPQP
jgi:peroxiredoxin